MLHFSQAQAEEFYQEHEGKSFFNNLIDFMTSGPVVGMELRGSAVVYKWRSLLGREDIFGVIFRTHKLSCGEGKAARKHPGTIRK